MVLGVQWLETLGPIEMDYKNLTISFNHDGVAQVFTGLGSSELTALSDKECHSLYAIGLFLQFVSIQDDDLSTPPPTDLVNLLTTYQGVFDPPTSLPPHRRHDHQIPLQPNNGPVNVQPYRYPHYQKSEIEKMVKELLESDLI